MGLFPGILAKVKWLKERGSLLQNRQSTPRVSRQRLENKLLSLALFLLLSSLGFTGLKLLSLWLLGFSGVWGVSWFFFSPQFSVFFFLSLKTDHWQKDTYGSVFEAGRDRVPFWHLQGEPPNQVMLPWHQFPVSPVPWSLWPGIFSLALGVCPFCPNFRLSRGSDLNRIASSEHERKFRHFSILFS